jgi:hypothetical protein
MPKAQEQRSFEFPGYTFNDQSAAVSFESSLAYTKSLSGLNTNQTNGNMQDTSIGSILMPGTDHGVSNGATVDVYWSGGVRYGCDAVVAGNTINCTNGAGNTLPANTTNGIAVVTQTDWEMDFDGDDAQIIGVFYRNPNDTGAKAHVDFQDSGSTQVNEVDLVHETANGGCDQIVNISGGDTNDYTGNAVALSKVSHDSLNAANVFCLVGLVAS